MISEKFSTNAMATAEGLGTRNFWIWKTVTMSSLRGRPVVVTFLYTTCQDSCPIQAQTVRGALDELGHDVPALAIAVDPPRDTPERAQAFLAKQSVDEEHMARITLVDSRGFQRIGYPGAEATPERLAHDLRLLEREAG